MFSVVEFPKTKEVEVVPSSWVVEPDQCLWPPFKSQKISQLVQSLTPASPDWSHFEARVLGKAGMTNNLCRYDLSLCFIVCS